MDVAHDEGDRGFLAAFAGRIEMSFKSEDAEMSPPGGEVGLSDLADELRWSHRSIISGSTGCCTVRGVTRALSPLTSWRVMREADRIKSEANVGV